MRFCFVLMNLPLYLVAYIIHCRVEITVSRCRSKKFTSHLHVDFGVVDVPFVVVGRGPPHLDTHLRELCVLGIQQVLDTTDLVIHMRPYTWRELDIEPVNHDFHNDEYNIKKNPVPEWYGVSDYCRFLLFAFFFFATFFVFFFINFFVNYFLFRPMIILQQKKLFRRKKVDNSDAPTLSEVGAPTEMSGLIATIESIRLSCPNRRRVKFLATTKVFFAHV